jgi:hypothetical protein
MTFPSIRVNAQVLALSLVLALGLWYMVTVRERLEVQAEVSLNYRGMPENLMVREGLLRSFTVQLRGPKTLIGNLDTRKLSYSVDLSSLQKGVNTITLSAPSRLTESRAISVTALFPDRFTLEAEAIMERTVPLNTKFKAFGLAAMLKAENLRAVPGSVTIRGPESLVKKTASITLEVPVDPEASAGDHERSLSVNTPPHVTASPGTVTVRYSIAGTRLRLELERTPLIGADDAQRWLVVPKKVLLLVELPEALAANKSYLDKIRVLVDTGALPPGGKSSVKPSVEIPEGARLLGISPGELSVTSVGK